MSSHFESTTSYGCVHSLIERLREFEDGCILTNGDGREEVKHIMFNCSSLMCDQF